jgi:hypothetical protein
VAATPFRIDVPQSTVDDLRDRLARTRWAERRFTRIVHWGEPDRGGHFGAWEQPELFVAELRATVRALPGRR